MAQFSDDEIDKRFSFHPADTDGKRHAHESIRNKCRELARDINAIVPDGRNKATALTDLQSVMQFANAGIATEWPEVDEPERL